MSKGKGHYKETIIDDVPVKVFTATNTAMLEYPYVLGRPEESSPTLAAQSREYILDSGIGNEDLTNEDILSRAHDLPADSVVPKDAIDDPYTTSDAVIEMVEMVDDTDVIIPLQSDGETTRVNHYYTLRDALQSLGYDITNYTIAIGGVNDVPVTKQIREAVKLRTAVDDDINIHMFGCGINREWVVAIRKWNGLIDQLDTSSVYKYVNNGSILDCEMKVRDYKMARGANSTCLYTMQRETTLYMFNHAIGPHANVKDVPTEFSDPELSELFSTHGH
jgi:hypothetical protein